MLKWDDVRQWSEGNGKSCLHISEVDGIMMKFKISGNSSIILDESTAWRRMNEIKTEDVGM